MNGRPRCVRSAGRRGVALMLVMGAVVIVFVIGMSVLSGLAATNHASGNLVQRETAVLLAESGIDEALDRLRNPPDSTLWPGVTGRQITGMDGSYDVSLTDLGEGLVEIRAVGRAAASGAAAHTIVLTASVEESAAGFRLRQAMMLGVGGFIPAADVKGDVHVNGIAVNLGRIDGTLSSSSSVIDLGQTQSVEQNAGTVDTPQPDFDAYRTYAYQGQSGQATVHTAAEAAALTGTIDPAGAGNPLGVVVIDGDLSLSGDIEIDGGILVVRGDLWLNGHALRVRGPGGALHLGLLVEGETRYNTSYSSIRVQDGAAYLNDRIRMGFYADNCELQSDSGIVAQRGLPTTFKGQIKADLTCDDAGVQLSYFGTDGGGSGGGGGAERTVTPVSYSPNPGS